MTPIRATGLGEPEPLGKKALFRPPQEEPERKQPEPEETRISAVPRKKEPAPESAARVRMTMEITKRSLAILQELRSEYRLRTGKSLPGWKIVSAAIECYGRKEQRAK